MKNRRLLLPLALQLWLLCGGPRLLPCHARTAFPRGRKTFDSVERTVRFVNHSQAKVDVFFIQDGQVAHSNTDDEGLLYGADLQMHSYISHSFQVEELPNDRTGKCRRKVCRKAYFTVSSAEDQVFTIQPDFFIKVEDHRTRAMAKAKAALEGCQQHVVGKQVDSSLDELASCLEHSINATLNETQDEISFQAGLRHDIGNRLVDYACNDDSLTTSATIQNRSWTFHSPMGVDIYHDVHVLFDSQYSSIQLVPNFLLPQQCHYIRDVAEKVSTTGLGTAEQPHPYAAQQWNFPLKAKDHATVGVLLNKIKSLLHEALLLDVEYDTDPLNLQVYIQDGPFEPEPEPEPEIDEEEDEDDEEKYRLVGCLRHLPTAYREKHGISNVHKGKNKAQQEADRRKKEKEEQCRTDVIAGLSGDQEDTCVVEEDEDVEVEKSLPPAVATTVDDENIVASLIVFCGGDRTKTPIKGGAIHFPRTGIHVRPRPGQAILMLYQDPRTGERDQEQFIHEYVACPVKQGSVMTFVDHFTQPLVLSADSDS